MALGLPWLGGCSVGAALSAMTAKGQGRLLADHKAPTVTSLSVDPPSLLVCVGRTASIARALVRLRHFSVNVLAAGQVEVAQAFGGQLAAVGAARFDYGHWRGLEGRGVPMLAGARASFDCEVAHVHDWATHHIVIGTVRAVQLAPEAQPSLAYADGQYRAVG